MQAKTVVIIAIGLLLCGALFNSVTAVIWPHHYPDWAVRTSNIIFPVAIIVTAVGVILLLKERDR